MVINTRGAIMTTDIQAVVSPARRAPRTCSQVINQIRTAATSHERKLAESSVPPIVVPSRSAGMKNPR